MPVIFSEAYGVFGIIASEGCVFHERESAHVSLRNHGSEFGKRLIRRSSTNRCNLSCGRERERVRPRWHERTLRHAHDKGFAHHRSNGASDLRQDPRSDSMEASTRMAGRGVGSSRMSSGLIPSTAWPSNESLCRPLQRVEGSTQLLPSEMSLRRPLGKPSPARGSWRGVPIKLATNGLAG